jgi:hypothetical protein
MTTETSATTTVSRRAWVTSGSSRIPRRLSRPPSKVCFTTKLTGHATRRKR